MIYYEYKNFLMYFISKELNKNNFLPTFMPNNSKNICILKKKYLGSRDPLTQPKFFFL